MTALSITTSSLPSFFVGKAYSATLSAAGGVTPYTWTITSGTLPNGLSLNATTGVISGTATALCAVNPCALTITVTDSSSTVATIQLQWSPSPTKTVASYDVLRDKVSPPVTQVANTTSPVVTAVDRQPKGSGTYFYAVRAVDANGLKAALSNIITVVP